MAELNPNASINLERASVMLLDDNPEGMGILVQIITAFGVKTLHRAVSTEAAERMAGVYALDLVLASATLRESSGYDFTSWLRRSKLDPNAFAPVILIAGHTVMSDVQKARDCGANFMVTKPLSPSILLQRIMWVARDKRAFVCSESYVGPERRIHDVGPPAGQPDRRPEKPVEKTIDVLSSGRGTQDSPPDQSMESAR